jgi:hypothetical protein
MVERRLKIGLIESYRLGSVDSDDLDAANCPLHGKTCPPVAARKNPYG